MADFALTFLLSSSTAASSSCPQLLLCHLYNYHIIISVISLVLTLLRWYFPKIAFPNTPSSFHLSIHVTASNDAKLGLTVVMCLVHPRFLKHIEVLWIVYEYAGQSALWLCARLVFHGEHSVGREGEICVYQAVDHSIKEHWDALQACKLLHPSIHI